jgi:hypothetical protein
MSDALTAILRETQELLTRESNDFAWSHWRDAQEADAELEKYLRLIERRDYSQLFDLEVLFAPTGSIQEVSISSGWGQEFLSVVARFDKEVELFGIRRPPNMA